MSEPTILCLSLWQPWATLIAIGEKQFETRHWSTQHRGSLLIHAAKKWDQEMTDICYEEVFRKALMRGGYLPPYGRPIARLMGSKNPLPFGSIIAICDLIDVYRTTGGRQLNGRNNTTHVVSEQEYAFGNYGQGRYAWQLENVREIEPIPYRGMQGLFEVPRRLVAEVLHV